MPKNKPEIDNLFDNLFDNLPDDIVFREIGNYLDTNSLSNLHRTSKNNYSLFHETVETRACLYKALLEAIFNDDLKEVKKILEHISDLILLIPNKNLVITSEVLNNHQFVAKSPLKIALEGGQIEMAQLLLSYCKNKEEQQEALKQCEAYEKSRKEKTTNRGQEYDDAIKTVIGAIAKGEKQGDAAIAEFKKKYCPKEKEAIQLGNVDYDALLLAAYRGYDKYFYTFQDWGQRDKFLIQVIGSGIQEFLPISTIKEYCQGLYEVAENKEPIGKIAQSLHLSNESKISYFDAYLGIRHFVSTGGKKGCEGRGPCGLTSTWLENFVNQKQSSLISLTASLSQASCQNLTMTL